MKRSGTADLALMGGSIPPWLFQRMTKLSLSIIEAILEEHGRKALLSRLSDPFWFQSFGAVIGMDWNSSGVTTAVMSALKKSINPHAKELGIYICGGKGTHSRQTPAELLNLGNLTGLDSENLARTSRLVAKVDNTAVQDGFQIYLHNFVVSVDGDWTVIQQGMNGKDQSARRYHWHSAEVESFTEEPHTGVFGISQGEILNLVAREAAPTKTGILQLTAEHPERILDELPRLRAPRQKGVDANHVSITRLGSILWLAHESETKTFEDLLLLKGLGPRTLQSLTLVSEVIHGTPSRFADPARFTFAHGAKGGIPFPVPTRVYDETIETLENAVKRARMGDRDKARAIATLTELAQDAERHFVPEDNVQALIEKEQRDSWKHGGRTVKGFVQKPDDGQLNLFD